MDTEFSDVLITPDEYIEEFQQRMLITPDCSLYRNAPLAVQIANIYRSHAIGHYYQSHGVNVTPMVRWGNELTYTTRVLPERAAFLGVEKHSIIAIGTYGCIRSRDDKYHFQAGLDAMMETLEPTIVLVYGSMPQKIFGVYADHAEFHQYDDWTSRMRSGA